jgi:hypothetical protein
MDAGARVEFSEQEYLTAQPGLIGLFFDMAKRKSEIKRDRKLQGDAVRRASGKLIGSVPWGYDPVLGTVSALISVASLFAGLPLWFLR